MHLASLQILFSNLEKAKSLLALVKEPLGPVSCPKQAVAVVFPPPHSQLTHVLKQECGYYGQNTAVATHC